jgi:peptide/nickel transport system substrate-binding protein
VVPYLAQSIVPNATYDTWTVTLRPNLMFHDGTPCDGAALTTNFEAQTASSLTGLVLKPIVSTITQTGPLTSTIVFNQPWVPFPYYLAGAIGGQVAFVAAPSMLSNPNGTSHPVGTGPFIFVEWQPNDYFLARKNPNYWRPGLPYLDEIEFRPIPDAQARSEALQAGSIDIMVDDTPQIIVKYRGNRSWSYIDDSGPVVGEPDMNCILLNTSAPPFNNPNVRLATAKAVSPLAYSQIIDIGVNAPSYGLFVPGTPYYSRTGYPKYDPVGATKLIKEAQQQAGKPISLTLGSTPDEFAVRGATYVQQKLQAVGMQVTLDTFEQNDLIDNALAGKFQAYEWRQFGAINPDMNYIFWSPTTINPGLAIDMTRNDDPIIQAALEVGRQSLSAQARYKAYQTVNKRLAIDLPYIWHDRAVWMIAAEPRVQNFNNPTTPTGARAYGMIAGSIWPTEIWLSQ